MKEFAGPQSKAIMAFARLDRVVLRHLRLVPFPCLVMAGLVPAIHAAQFLRRKTWMPGTSPGMTTFGGKR
jgi:hypothetical protein